MIIGALGLALGQRAHADMLRADDRPTLVEALFDVTAYPHLPELFNTLGITVDDASLLLKRVLTKSGSRCYINAQLATVAMLQQAGQYLVDILGQHQQQTLLQREQQLALLDSFGKLTEEHRPAAPISTTIPSNGTIGVYARKHSSGSSGWSSYSFNCRRLSKPTCRRVKKSV